MFVYALVFIILVGILSSITCFDLGRRDAAERKEYALPYIIIGILCLICTVTACITLVIFR